MNKICEKKDKRQKLKKKNCGNITKSNFDGKAITVLIKVQKWILRSHKLISEDRFYVYKLQYRAFQSYATSFHGQEYTSRQITFYNELQLYRNPLIQWNYRMPYSKAQSGFWLITLQPNFVLCELWWHKGAIRSVTRQVLSAVFKIIIKHLP